MLVLGHAPDNRRRRNAGGAYPFIGRFKGLQIHIGYLLVRLRCIVQEEGFTIRRNKCT
jgi:hypothetical protein